VQSEATRYWLAVTPALLILAGTPVALLAVGRYRLTRAAFAAAAPPRDPTEVTVHAPPGC